MLMSILAYGSVYILIGKAIMPAIESFLREHHVVRINYAEEVIPTAFGLFIYGMLIIHSFLLTIWSGASLLLLEGVFATSDSLLHPFLLWSGLIMWAGWLDDTKGNRHIKGFKGHIGSLLRDGNVTTGLVKAAMAGLVAFWAVIELGGHWNDRVIRFMIIVLTTNAINLLDLRPGRAIKGFYLGSIILFIGSQTLSFLPFWLPLAIASLLVLPSDLGGAVMIGDTGANVLGFGLGFCLAVAAPNGVLMFMLLLLVILHWKAERSSLTAVIERNIILNSIDRWGRAR